jgi:hypothetical protein
MRGEPWIAEPAQQELDIAHPHYLFAGPRIAGLRAGTQRPLRKGVPTGAKTPS